MAERSDFMKEALINLIKVKSLVTLFLTGLLVYTVIAGIVDGKYFETVFTTVIAFYFGTQYQKAQGTIEQPVEPSESEEQ